MIIKQIFDRTNASVKSLGIKKDGSLPIDDDQIDVVSRNLEAVMKWAEFCIACKRENYSEEEIDNCGEDPFEETNFYDVSIGFFIALGVSLSDAFELSTITRYRYQYWEHIS